MSRFGKYSSSSSSCAGIWFSGGWIYSVLSHLVFLQQESQLEDERGKNEQLKEEADLLRRKAQLLDQVCVCLTLLVHNDFLNLEVMVTVAITKCQQSNSK